MKQSKREPLKIKQTRCFSEEFKKAKVKELVEKQISIGEVVRLYSVSRTAVYKWLYRYSVHHQQKVKLVVEMESEGHKTKRLQERVAELERAVGQKQLEIDFLNKLLEIGGEELGFDLKKNLSTRLSNGSGETKETTGTK